MIPDSIHLIEHNSPIAHQNQMKPLGLYIRHKKYIFDVLTPSNSELIQWKNGLKYRACAQQFLAIKQKCSWQLKFMMNQFQMPQYYIGKQPKEPFLEFKSILGCKILLFKK